MVMSKMPRSAGLGICGLAVVVWFLGGSSQARDAPAKLPKGVAEKVDFVLKYVDEHKTAPKGHVGGRTFENRERRLPARNARGKLIAYREWDIHPRTRGRDRGSERLVTGSDGSAYYTPDHYRTFKKIR
jgi:guanyl-specific ribonuclease Sa